MQDPHKSLIDSTYSLELKSYVENKDFLAEGKPEPSSRSQTLIYHGDNKRWSIKPTLLGSISDTGLNDTGSQQKIPKRERRKEFQDFVKMINYKSLPPLDDTVTKVLLEQVIGISGTLEMNDSAEGASNRIANLAGNLRYSTREDLERVIYPLCIFSSCFNRIDASGITEEAEIKDATGVTVSDNPYKTSTTSNVPPVVTGILLEAHSGGSLQRVFAERRTEMYRWRQWAIQIGSALSHFYEARWTHMDLKPSNVVLDAEGNAIVIDISGIVGMTHAWRAPGVRDETSPLELPFQARRLNGVWVYGKLLSEPAFQIGENYSVWPLEWIADGLMREDPETRMSLSGAVWRLKAIDHLVRREIS
ncbi:hypothetical protein BDV24DRAFT_158469 [Aspergillus arachidicola]|uniref:Uncharacterized protein n=1 Tax=Aspergillus arachidicola TaxID=656916 RepID=A0A2G7FYG3_9EURO|nr:hypothetical protein BDV24DRAFT_158469 [Aspergillus arachidicola]PIG85628.1 hypothetical protein AARAC_002975 [Aspergillus arachidicola]